MYRDKVRTFEGLSFDDVLIVPKKGILASRDDADTHSRIGKFTFDIPIISSPMETVTGPEMVVAMQAVGGLGVLHRFGSEITRATRIEFLLERQAKPIALAFGIKGEPPDYLRYADILFMDVAHAHANHAIKYLDKIRKLYPDTPIIAGSVATRSGARDMLIHGADGIRVGIGPGMACSTRIKTGAGIPALTAILDCADIASEYNAIVVADGGIRNSGDAAKALAAGADFVMLGGLLAGADEAPMGNQFFGQASSAATSSAYVEGVVGTVPDSGPVKNTINELMAGIRSAISYAGAISIQGLHDRAEFIKVTPLSIAESKPRI